MKSEVEPIADDEWLLRRVHVNWIRPARTPIISPDAFAPREEGRSREPDIDGISLYRSDCLRDPLEILAAVDPAKLGQQGIVRVQVAFLRSLGLSVVSKPDKIVGHVVIPELNAAAYSADRGRFVALKQKMAVEASKPENTVKHPE